MQAASIDDDLNAAVALLHIVAAQDLAPDEKDNVTIRREVAPDREISIVDPDAHHGYRARHDRYDRFKAHLSVDPDFDLITAATASKATTSDGEMLAELLESDPLPVSEVIADTHYGGSKIRRTFGAKGVELVAPAPPPSARAGFFNKADFTIELEHHTVTLLRE